eukprot:TRINITY_DN4135_c0_g7_i1.p1 TRINITY_DN4135_c0_g7~~TRINITY_DN4135_c0_g7_i1.p1  ORF type:complete len:102 (+),score=5.90 TRINITY_DN4135_c0_g7_i1:676-981(+)
MKKMNKIKYEHQKKQIEIPTNTIHSKHSTHPHCSLCGCFFLLLPLYCLFVFLFPAGIEAASFGMFPFYLMTDLACGESPGELSYLSSLSPTFQSILPLTTR